MTVKWDSQKNRYRFFKRYTCTRKCFSTQYGTLIAEGPLRGLSARVIFVVGKDGVVTYKEIVPEITEEPNYEAALAALKDAAAK